ncbi:hypothetical protein [Streptomyces sp. NPDC088925]|uniref:hypothetical protein n=1 Tax=Streptomyces sp. NPDC088925 TaxID=3365914 RepID=UPI00380437D5
MLTETDRYDINRVVITAATRTDSGLRQAASLLADLVTRQSNDEMVYDIARALADTTARALREKAGESAHPVVALGLDERDPSPRWVIAFVQAVIDSDEITALERWMGLKPGERPRALMSLVALTAHNWA